MFTTKVRIYYEDTDAGGIVYHANYLKFMERNRCDWLASIGFSVTDLERDYGIMFVVKQAALDYDQPARLFDQLRVETKPLQVGKVRLVAEQCIYNNEALICRGEIKLATLSSASYTLAPMPEALQKALVATA